MPGDESDPNGRSQLTAAWIELAIRLSVLALLIYLAFLLISPFITLAIWSIVLTVALYPGYSTVVGWLGQRRRLAALVLTIVALLIVLGPATWLVLQLIDGVASLSERLDLAHFAMPAPPETVKGWPLIGEPVYQFWQLASTNLQMALAKIAPQLRPVGTKLLEIAAGAGTGALKFLIALIIAGFLFPAAPTLVEYVNRFSRRLAPEKGEVLVQIATATIRAVARGVIGVAALQAFLIGIGLVVAGVPGSSLITTLALVLGIIQIGPTPLVIPVIIWGWITMDTLPALLFTAYMIPVNLIDNLLRPLVMGRGLDTPIVIILIGLIGGTISIGITGLFLGPIILAVIWKLLWAWTRESEA
jgi:predicted PurR-regulated permease PerM